jgi:Tol biopolymer transport system component
MRRWLTIPGILLALSACEDAAAPPTGSIVVTVQTTGRDLDLDGYTVAVDGDGSTPLPSSGTVTLTNLASGEHTLTLAGLVANCALQGDSAITVSVTDDVPASAALTVVCAFANTLAYTQGNVMYVTGIEPGAVPVQVATDFTAPSWSPDGSTLALVSTVFPRGIFLVDAGGGTPRSVTGPVPDTDRFARAAWSPDGRTLVFNYRNFAGAISRLDVRLKRVSADGTGYDLFIGEQILSENATWAPDGARVAFDDTGNICLANPAGGDVQCLARGVDAEWSPDGTALAFATYDATEIYTIQRDGSNQRKLTEGAGGFNYLPIWSPDGNQIAYVHRPSIDANGVYMLMNADGSGKTPLTPTLSAYGEIAWSFDGVHLALVGKADGDAADRVYVIRRDGSGLTPVSGEGACCLDWRP